MKFKDYLKHNCVNQSAFSKKYHLPNQTLSRVVKGCSVSLITAARIVDATKGEVSYEDLLSTDEWHEMQRREKRGELTKEAQELRMGINE